MKKFQVKVNGKQYVVEVEEINEQVTPSTNDQAQAPLTSQAQANVADAPAVATTETGDNTTASVQVAAEAQGVAEGYAVKAPLRGQILKVAVKPGDKVSRGQLVCTIEALKLENEIASPVAGTVTGVFTQAGKTADTGEVLVTIKEE